MTTASFPDRLRPYSALRLVEIVIPLVLLLVPGRVRGSEPLLLHARSQVETGPDTGQFRVAEETLRWAPSETAVVICDMWDRHWCRGATERVAAMAPRVDAFVKAARERGVLIIHCPSDTLKAYEGTPQRRLAQSAPVVELRTPVQGWCSLDLEHEAPLPIDDSDGGCDDSPACDTAHPWTRQIATIEIHPGDAITDSAEALHLMAQRGIQNVMVLGVHLNMCVLGRPFGIRQLTRQGKQAVLVRDLTDTMYNSRLRPQVPHFTGTDLMVEHVERYWCPSITSADLLGGDTFRFPADRRPRIVAMVGEDEYGTWETVPAWVTSELLPDGYAVTIVHEGLHDPGRFPTLERSLANADLLLVSIRRRALPPDQMRAVRRHLDAGRPLVAIRTSSHAFDPRGELAEAVQAGERVGWVEFDPVVLGGNYHGHHGNGPVTSLTYVDEAADHFILQGISTDDWTSAGSLYRVGPLAEGAVPILKGTIPGQPSEPIAWTHRYGPKRARVFYTSLGHRQDFEEPRYRRLLMNAIRWGLGGEGDTKSD